MVVALRGDVHAAAYAVAAGVATRACCRMRLAVAGQECGCPGVVWRLVVRGQSHVGLQPHGLGGGSWDTMI